MRLQTEQEERARQIEEAKQRFEESQRQLLAMLEKSAAEMERAVPAPSADFDKLEIEDKAKREVKDKMIKASEKHQRGPRLRGS